MDPTQWTNKHACASRLQCKVQFTLFLPHTNLFHSSRAVLGLHFSMCSASYCINNSIYKSLTLQHIGLHQKQDKALTNCRLLWRRKPLDSPTQRKLISSSHLRAIIQVKLFRWMMYGLHWMKLNDYMQGKRISAFPPCGPGSYALIYPCMQSMAYPLSTHDRV